jgi:hypothetical protein
MHQIAAPQRFATLWSIQLVPGVRRLVTSRLIKTRLGIIDFRQEVMTHANSIAIA